MATYYEVTQDPQTALRKAATLAARHGKSQTIYFPKNGPLFYLVGPTTGAPDMRAAGALPLYSIQCHPQTFDMKTACPDCLGESMECWSCEAEERGHDPA